MMNVFTMASNDQSLYYLGQIFGNIGGVLPVANGPVAVGLMFKVLNTAALSVGALIVVYTTVAGLLSTASEGEFLGKKWSGLWVPVRTVLGIVGLFPSSGGYCAIQVIIMWLILQGIGLADTVWSSVLTLIEQQGSVYVTVRFPDINPLIKPTMQDLFKGLVCYESRTYVPDTKDQTSTNYMFRRAISNYFCVENPKDPICGKPLPSFDPESKTEYTLGKCGTLQVCDASAACSGNNSTSLPCELCKAEHQALPVLISTMDAIAKQIVEWDYQYQKFYYTSNMSNKSETPQWIQDFCSDNPQIGTNCCANGVPQNNLQALIVNVIPASDDTNCRSTLFSTDYPPFIPADLTKGKSEDKGSSSENVVQQIYEKFAVAPYTDKIDFVTAAANQYVGVLTGAYTSRTAAITGTKLTDWREESKNNGWILAGMYYYQITQGSASEMVTFNNLPRFAYINLPNIGTSSSSSRDDVAKFRNNVSTAAQLLTLINQRGQDSYSTNNSATPALAKIVDSDSIKNIVSSFMSDVTGLNEKTALGSADRVVGQAATNPLYRISIYGYNLIWVTQLLFWVTVAIAVTAAMLNSINFMGFGSGFTTNPFYEGFKTFMSLVSPFWALALSSLFSTGVLLGVYIPFIPYIIYTMGVIGWMMATIEAMVAGPIIALGILSPSGQHEILGKAEPAVMIIFNLILRPGLMVFGLVTSLFLSAAVVTLINQSFLKVASNIITHPAIVESILMMMMYVLFIVMALNKVFSLIHVIPEKVLTYIGGQAISYGESEGLAGMKQGMEGGASGMAGAAKEVPGGVAAGIGKVQEGMAHEAEQKKQAGIQATQAAAAMEASKESARQDPNSLD